MSVVSPYGKLYIIVIPAKKSLGQHFLTNRSHLRAVADAAELSAGETVVEIGPGKGSLTAELLVRGAHVIALEKDARLIPLLQEKFAPEIAAGQLEIVETDALECEPSDYGLVASGYALVGNIPYYITGALIEKFLTVAAQPSMIVFLIQKEVAERIARSKKESILSLSVKVYGSPKYIKTVPAGAFSPAPKVDSAILAITRISRGHFMNTEHEKKFFTLVKAGFAHKRKLLARNLEPVLGKQAEEKLVAAGIAPKARAEDVPLEKWLLLAN